MCEQLQGAAELVAAARALTLACLLRARGAPVPPLNEAYDHVVCEPVPDDMTALLVLLTQDRASI